MVGLFLFLLQNGEVVAVEMYLHETGCQYCVENIQARRCFVTYRMSVCAGACIVHGEDKVYLNTC